MLTKEEQEQYAEDNIKLVHYFARKWHNTGIDHDELTGIAMIGYTEAIKRFDPGKGVKFSAYAGLTINSALSKFWKKEKKRIKTISLESTVNDSDSKVTTILDMIPSPKKDEMIQDVQEVLNEVIRYMPEQKAQAMKMYLEGKTQAEIGEVLGISQARASRIIREVMQIVKDEYWNYEKTELSKNPKKAVMNMTISQEEYNSYKSEGKSDKEIAKIKGMSQANLSYYKSKWSKAEAKPRTPKLILEENESSPSVHEDLLSDLSKKLRKAEARNEKLEKELTEMEKRVNELHAAAEDAEEEAAASIEYMEREQQLMIEANVWKQKALQYEAEYKRQTDTLKEERAEKERYKGEALAFRLALKAVL